MLAAQIKLQSRLGHVGSDVFLELLPTSAGEVPLLADVCIRTEHGDEVWAHRCILSARSSYFRSLLSAKQLSHELPPLPVRVTAILAVLRFLYTDTVHFDVDDVEKLRELFCNLSVQFFCSGFSHFPQSLPRSGRSLFSRNYLVET